MYPALSIIRFLRGKQGAGSLRYVGNSRGLERSLLSGTGIPSHFFPMAAPNSAGSVAILALAVIRSLALVLRHRPDVTFATGGYVSAPAVVASWILRVPVVLFLPDVVPGKAIRRLLPLARSIAVSTEDALPYIPRAKGTVTGYPVRDTFLTAAHDSARERFGLPADVPVICVFGGSLGARSVNQALASGLHDILGEACVIHIAGRERMPEARAAAHDLSPSEQDRYLLFPFLDADGMAAALAAADIVVCRSGASTLGELPATGAPAVLVPLPERSVHQLENARYLADRGAAVILPDDRLSELPDVLAQLLLDREVLLAMRAAMERLAQPDAARNIAAVIEDAS